MVKIFLLEERESGFVFVIWIRWCGVYLYFWDVGSSLEEKKGVEVSV